jgi:hypothetical protein
VRLPQIPANHRDFFSFLALLSPGVKAETGISEGFPRLDQDAKKVRFSE